jgi:NADH-quinone oxidoreductase subunit K
MIPMIYYLGLAVVLFGLGLVGVLLRRNALVIFMSLELMFNAANLVFVSFSNYYNLLDGQALVIFVMVAAAADVAVGLALMVMIFRTKGSIDIDQMSKLKE